MQWIAHLRIFLLITVISAVVYANSLYNPFHFDDQHYIVTNPYITSIHNIPSFFKSSQYSSFENVFTGHYRPLLVTSYAINYAIGGLNPVGYHVVNLLFHIGAAFLVFLILEAMIEGQVFLPAPYPLFTLPPIHPIPTPHLIPLASALIFAVHPFNSEVVNYITARSSVMCSFFYLLSFYCWVEFRSQKLDVRSQMASYFLPLTSHFYIASLLAFLLAMLTKEIAITLPAMLFLYDMYFFKFRIPHSAFRILKAYVPFVFLIVIPYLIYRFLYYGGITGGMSGDFFPNLLTQPEVMLKYMQLMLFPFGLTIEHDIMRSAAIYDISKIGYIISLLLIITVSYILFKKGAQWRILSFFILWFFITLLPTTIIPLNAILQENRGYLSGIGFTLFAGICIGKLPQRASLPLLIALISAYSIMTIHRNTIWKDDYTLWTDAVVKAPYSARVHDNLGLAYMGKEKYGLAITEFNKTLELNPYYYLAYYNAGVAYQLQNKPDLARSSYEACIKINPQYFRAYYNLGTVNKKLGDLNKAIEAYEKAISLDARHPFVYNNLGVALTEKGEIDKAESIFKRAIETDPLYEKAYFNLGNLYYKAGKYSLAAEAYRSALRIKPEYKEAKEMLEAIKGEKGGLP